MDQYLRICLEHIALAGNSGCSLVDLWDSISKDINIPVTDPLKTWLWKHLLDFSRLSIGHPQRLGFFFSQRNAILAPGTERHNIGLHDPNRREATKEELSLSRMELEEDHQGMILKLVASTEARIKVLGIDDPLRFGPLTFTILEAIGAGKSNGVIQSDLAKSMSIDPKTLFHHIKKLDQAGLINRRSTLIRTLSSNQDNFIRSNLITLSRFRKLGDGSVTKEEEKEADGDGNATGEEHDDDAAGDSETKRSLLMYSEIAMRICRLLAASKHWMLKESELKSECQRLLGFQSKRGVWKVMKKMLIKNQYIQPFLGKAALPTENKDKSVKLEWKMLKLLKLPQSARELEPKVSDSSSIENDDEMEIQDDAQGRRITKPTIFPVLVGMPLDYTIWSVIKSTGSRGVYQCFLKFEGINKKTVAKRIEKLIKTKAICSISHVDGKLKTYILKDIEYQSTNIAPEGVKIVPSPISRAKPKASTSNIADVPFSSSTTNTGNASKQLTIQDLTGPKHYSKLVTGKHIRRKDFVLQTVKERKVVPIFDLKSQLVRNEELFHSPEDKNATVPDRKALLSLVKELAEQQQVREYSTLVAVEGKQKKLDFVVDAALSEVEVIKEIQNYGGDLTNRAKIDYTDTTLVDMPTVNLNVTYLEDYCIGGKADEYLQKDTEKRARMKAKSRSQILLLSPSSNLILDPSTSSTIIGSSIFPSETDNLPNQQQNPKKRKVPTSSTKKTSAASSVGVPIDQNEDGSRTISIKDHSSDKMDIVEQRNTQSKQKTISSPLDTNKAISLDDEGIKEEDEIEDDISEEEQDEGAGGTPEELEKWRHAKLYGMLSGKIDRAKCLHYFICQHLFNPQAIAPLDNLVPDDIASKFAENVMKLQASETKRRNKQNGISRPKEPSIQISMESMGIVTTEPPKLDSENQENVTSLLPFKSGSLNAQQDAVIDQSAFCQGLFGKTTSTTYSAAVAANQVEDQKNGKRKSRSNAMPGSERSVYSPASESSMAPKDFISAKSKWFDGPSFSFEKLMPKMPVYLYLKCLGLTHPIPGISNILSITKYRIEDLEAAAAQSFLMKKFYQKRLTMSIEILKEMNLIKPKLEILKLTDQERLEGIIPEYILNPVGIIWFKEFPFERPFGVGSTPIPRPSPQEFSYLYLFNENWAAIQRYWDKLEEVTTIYVKDASDSHCDPYGYNTPPSRPYFPNAPGFPNSCLSITTWKGSSIRQFRPAFLAAWPQVEMELTTSASRGGVTKTMLELAEKHKIGIGRVVKFFQSHKLRAEQEKNKPKSSMSSNKQKGRKSKSIYSADVEESDFSHLDNGEGDDSVPFAASRTRWSSKLHKTFMNTFALQKARYRANLDSLDTLFDHIDRKALTNAIGKPWEALETYMLEHVQKSNQFKDLQALISRKITDLEDNAAENGLDGDMTSSEAGKKWSPAVLPKRKITLPKSIEATRRKYHFQYETQPLHTPKNVDPRGGKSSSQAFMEANNYFRFSEKLHLNSGGPSAGSLSASSWMGLSNPNPILCDHVKSLLLFQQCKEYDDIVKRIVIEPFPFSEVEAAYKYLHSQQVVTVIKNLSTRPHWNSNFWHLIEKPADYAMRVADEAQEFLELIRSEKTPDLIKNRNQNKMRGGGGGIKDENGMEVTTDIGKETESGKMEIDPRASSSSSSLIPSMPSISSSSTPHITRSILTDWNLPFDPFTNGGSVAAIFQAIEEKLIHLDVSVDNVHTVYRKHRKPTAFTKKQTSHNGQTDQMRITTSQAQDGGALDNIDVTLKWVGENGIQRYIQDGEVAPFFNANPTSEPIVIPGLPSSSSTFISFDEFANILTMLGEHAREEENTMHAEAEKSNPRNPLSQIDHHRIFLARQIYNLLVQADSDGMELYDLERTVMLDARMKIDGKSEPTNFLADYEPLMVIQDLLEYMTDFGLLIKTFGVVAPLWVVAHRATRWTIPKTDEIPSDQPSSSSHGIPPFTPSSVSVFLPWLLPTGNFNHTLYRQLRSYLATLIICSPGISEERLIMDFPFFRPGIARELLSRLEFDGLIHSKFTYYYESKWTDPLSSTSHEMRNPSYVEEILASEYDYELYIRRKYHKIRNTYTYEHALDEDHHVFEKNYWPATGILTKL